MAVALVVSSCSGDDDDLSSPATAPTAPPVTAGPVAAVDLVVGDCLAGLVIGAAERRRIDAARVVSCESDHELEVFAMFGLVDADFERTEPGVYPGQQRVVAAADEGCTNRFEDLGVDEEAFGLIALWPTDRSWAAGDRDVACAAFSSDGTAFEGRQLLADRG